MSGPGVFWLLILLAGVGLPRIILGIRPRVTTSAEAKPELRMQADPLPQPLAKTALELGTNTASLEAVAAAVEEVSAVHAMV